MTSQFSLLEPATPEVPEGLRYQPGLISEHEEDTLLAHVRELPFKEFEFHGYKGKRRVVSFGWQYEFSGRGKLRKADDVPEFLLPLRTLAAKSVGIESESLQHVLVIEYGPGAGIGWHRDKPVFGDVVGISLLAPCMLRFRRKVSAPTMPHSKAGHSPRDSSLRSSQWERASFLAEPRSAYYLTGPARWEWEHSILRVEALRYSITFRNVLAS